MKLIVTEEKLSAPFKFGNEFIDSEQKKTGNLHHYIFRNIFEYFGVVY